MCIYCQFFKTQQQLSYTYLNEKKKKQFSDSRQFLKCYTIISYLVSMESPIPNQSRTGFIFVLSKILRKFWAIESGIFIKCFVLRQLLKFSMNLEPKLALRGREGVSFPKVFRLIIKITYFLTFESLPMHIHYYMKMWHSLRE